ncbi:hypothetical protein UCREL1_6536 [Eutypa lata UCREL1]|uniref:Uncharacterized protein n=1 Tax=Eutypa lata (strain UCR-EL1) TaxID=1287681 RepID=M7SJE4_EUTLA|nr:hypothetical protein UCREL1_6536 [Eutypa lata UCREL1]
MQGFDIVLVEGGDPHGAFRTRNAPGDKARSLMVDRGKALILQARLVSVTHGHYVPDGDFATLLVFEFKFSNVRGRFTGAIISLSFEDASGQVTNRPYVAQIAPMGSWAINKTTKSRDIYQRVEAGVGSGVPGATYDLSYAWETSQVKERQHATKLDGIKRLFADWGKENGVVWNLKENPDKKDGIPNFLRTAVLLRRCDDVPFYFTISVDSSVDFEGKLRRFLGIEKPDAVDPIELDGETDLEGLDIATLGPEKVDVANMSNMDIASIADVSIATSVTVPT